MSPGLCYLGLGGDYIGALWGDVDPLNQQLDHPRLLGRKELIP